MRFESRLSGKGYGDWGANWWKWALEIALEEHPIFDPTGEFCGVDQKGKT